MCFPTLHHHDELQHNDIYHNDTDNNDDGMNSFIFSDSDFDYAFNNDAVTIDIVDHDSPIQDTQYEHTYNKYNTYKYYGNFRQSFYNAYYHHNKIYNKKKLLNRYKQPSIVKKHVKYKNREDVVET